MRGSLDGTAEEIGAKEMNEQPRVRDDARNRLDRGSLFIAIAIPLLSAYAPSTSVDVQGLADVVGSWKGGEVLEFVRPDSQIVFFSVRSDSSLSLSMIYEVGPRARAWTYDIDVHYTDGQISWAYHTGHLNATRDTMWVSKDYGGDRSEWMWVRDKSADPLMDRLRTLEEAPYEYSVPESLADGWGCDNPESVGIDRTGIARFLGEVSQGTFGDLHSLLLVRHNTLVVEDYFAKQGEWHGELIDSVFRDRSHHLASVTKSITSALVGIAINRGSIQSVQDPIIRYLPAHAALLSDEKEALTIEHLLTMSSGLRRPRDDGQLVWQGGDVVGYVLDQPLVSEPGQRFVYSNGSAAVVGAVLENATGRTVESFAEEFLFRPLGITDHLWTSYPDGTVETDGGLALRPRDLAKIGQAFLQQGRWRDFQVIPADWVAESTKQRQTYRSAGVGQMGYGYFWMQMRLPYNDTTITSFCHFGDGGQLLMVIPELDMVVVLSGGAYGATNNRYYYRVVSEYVLPAVDPGF
jgi:CubicO group peptidase (beta-lactamase class C family)